MRQKASVLVGIALGTILSAQAPERLAFEVVSIKSAAPNPLMSAYGFQPGGRFRASSVTVRNLIASAFVNPGPPPDVPGASYAFSTALLPNQIVGGPGWIGTDRFDVEGKVDEALAKTNVNLIQPPGTTLLRSLLEDRFKLVTHMETRDLPVFALTLEKSDGTLGPKLKRSSVDCQALAQARARGGPSPVPGETPCFPKTGPGLVQGTGIPLTFILGVLRTGVGGFEVVDRTGITGRFDIDLHFSVQPGGGPAADPLAAVALPDGDSVFTAVQEQLGLKLEGRREPRPVLVIDHIERPTED